MPILMRKKKFLFPVKIHGEGISTRRIEENIREIVENGTHALIGGGKEFIIPVAKTESFEVKQSVKNVMQGLLKAVCIILYA